MAGQVAEAADRVSFGGTGLGIILAGIVLLLVFGSIFAMALPLVSALASLGTAIGVIGLLSHVLKMPQFSTELVLLIGLGVGVDYALFIVTRHRQGLIAGNDGRVRRSSTPSTPRAGPCCSPASSCASPCSGCSPSGSPSSTGWPSPPRSAWPSP